MANIKRVYDARLGTYDVLTSTPQTAIVTKTAVAGIVSASVGETTFVLSGSGVTVRLPPITLANIGSPVVLMTDASVTVSGVHGLVSPTSAWTTTLGAFSASCYTPVSGTAGYYWHSSF